MTQFIVLQKREPRDTDVVPDAWWEEVATVDANSKEQAVKSIGGGGTRVAIPTRSWQPVRLEIETVQKTRLSAATPVKKEDA